MLFAASRKVFKKLGFEVSDDVIHSVTTCKPWAAEQLLLMLRDRVTQYTSSTSAQCVSPPASATGSDRLEHGQSCNSDDGLI